MKRMWPVLVVLGMTVGSVAAQPGDLTGGVFICHAAPGIVETDPPYYCENFALANCDDQNTMIPSDDFAARAWYIVSNFYEAKMFNAIEYGISYGGTQYAPIFAAVCAPSPFLTIEYPTTGAWPADGSAIAIALIGHDTYWQGTMVTTGYIAGYHYSYSSPGTIRLVSSPQTGFIGWASDYMHPSITFPPTCIGSMGFDMPGVTCCSQPPPFMACCLPDYSCMDVASETLCESLRGTLYPNALCQDDPCPQPPAAACCLPDCTCIMATEAECLAQGGVWHPEHHCEDSNPCGLTPSPRTTWGEVKAIYR